jgi:endonuclease-3 related protein
MKKITVIELYDRLLSHFGPRDWWPAETRFEVMVGAILTQNTSWGNVEKAIINLKSGGLMEPGEIAKARIKTLEQAVFPSGFFRQKAVRLKDFSKYLLREYDGDLDRLFRLPVEELRSELLEQKGIGPETADSMILYAGNKPIFVIDSYTKRLCDRLGLCDLRSYDEYQDFFMRNLPEDTELYNEYHALIVVFCKNICRRNPDCENCFLRKKCNYS